MEYGTVMSDMETSDTSRAFPVPDGARISVGALGEHGWPPPSVHAVTGHRDDHLDQQAARRLGDLKVSLPGLRQKARVAPIARPLEATFHAVRCFNRLTERHDDFERLVRLQVGQGRFS